jgi:glycosyltransferase involved in cell wall biosynthesis
MMRSLSRIVRRERIDLVHAYERVPVLEAYYGPHLVGRTPMIATIMAMSVPPYIPGSLHLIVGTTSLLESVGARRRRGPVELQEPPIDVREDAPTVDGSGFARTHGVSSGDVNLVLVSRLHRVMKQQGIELAMDAIERVGREHPLRLFVVGSGPAEAELRARAERVNASLGRAAVVLTGEVLDPRPAYASADVVLGMGSSILRGMAFEKPAIVLGDGGFSEVVEPATIDRFLQDGFYGVGDVDGVVALSTHLRRLVDDPGLRGELGRFARSLVSSRFSLEAAARWLAERYEAILETPVRRSSLLAEALGTIPGVLGFRLRQHRRGRVLEE